MGFVNERLRQLRERWALPEAAPAQLAEILQRVADEPSSITTVRDPELGVELHVADALAALRIPAVRAAGRIADLGAGGGFPGLALAAALPECAVTLVESVGRKCAFLRLTAEAVGLTNVDVVHARAEEWRDGLGRSDVITARALAPLAVLAEYAAPLLRDGGVLVAWKGLRDPQEEADGAAAAGVLGLAPADVLVVDDVPGVDHRSLYLYSKVRETPSRFPRRAGMARKRPLRP